jgi:NADH:ubiquinone oxidoreductase subunit E
MDDSALGLLDDLPRERTWVLPALLRVQKRFGHISSDAIEAIATHLRLTPSDVDGIASGYADLRRVPRAPINVRVCVGVSCALAGADDLELALEQRASTRLEISCVPCLFACALAPVVEVGSTCLGRATETAITEAIAEEGRTPRE